MRPILVSFGGVELLAAPVFAGLAAIASAWYFHRHKDHARLDGDAYWDLMLPLAFGTVAGGVLFYLLFYGSGPAGNLARLARTHRVGGGAFYGDLLGALAAAWLACRRRGWGFRRVGDLVGASAPLGLAVMRLGCFQHGCCHGRAADAPWAVAFGDPRSAVKRSLLGVPIHPTQLYEFAAALALFLVLRAAVLPRAKDGRLPAGAALLCFLVLYGGARFVLDFFRGCDPGIVRPLGLTTAQAVSLVLVAVAGGLWTRWSREPA